MGSGPVRGQLTARGVEGRTLAVTGLAQAFTRANDRCLAGTAVNARLADAERAAGFAVLGRDYFDILAADQALSPAAVQIASPHLAAHGFDGPSISARICVKLRIDDVVVPDLGPSQTGTLTVVAGLTLAGGPTVFSPAAGVSFCSDPTGIGGGCTPFRPTDAAGQVTFPVTATPSGSIRYAVCAHISQGPRGVSFAGLFLTLAVPGPPPCRTSVGGVVVTPAQTVIAPGASRQFTAVVEDTMVQEVTWVVSGGGAITATGLFTSNGTPGTFRVRAISKADPSSEGGALVTVTGSGGGGEEGPCPGGCSFPGTFTFCNEGTCSAPTLGSVTAHTFRPLPTSGRSGGSLAGVVVRSPSGCRDFNGVVNVPISGNLSAGALAFVVNIRSTSTTLGFASTAAAAGASSREER